MKCINFIEQIKKDIQEPLLSEMNIDNKLTYDDKIQPLLSCLSRRTITNNYMFLSLNENEGVNSIYLLCKQIEYCLNKAFLFECNLIECYWILFLISIFNNLFTTNTQGILVKNATIELIKINPFIALLSLNNKTFNKINTTNKYNKQFFIIFFMINYFLF